ncbi:PucR family transcriptional regulator ligand-binding domain-containing protein [Micromonospora sp. WMMD1102]|uniref:PucR family transcriptional regulator n=1 Tax=Micromonospora sp. WMMD1102 TaxID=3016105 RepID=UPI002415158B|nr:PucR family transcriptional regulator [Micromonospora sp. WMMD1102]MDG4788392.1 PucR family transcriptional regulator ligand-binding domain-containing protein [Micromonospora sp. WMMD1102]
MLLREALDRPQLRLTLLTGEAGLDRPVSRVYVTDLPDPRRYLSGGEIVLTGLMWRRRADDSDGFVAACAAAGVAAIGAGDAAYGSVPPDLVTACHRYGVPLFEVPVEVSFREIIDEVTPTLWARRANGLATVLGRYRGLVAAMAGGARLADLLQPVAADLSVDCWVLTSTGRTVAGTGPLPGETRRRLATSFLAAGRLPVLVEAGGRRSWLVAVPGRPEHRLAGWLLACADATEPTGATEPTEPTVAETAGATRPAESAEPARPTSAEPVAGTGRTGTATSTAGTARSGTAGTAPPAGLPEAAAELVSLVALERAHADEAGRVERRLADQLGAVLCTGTSPAELRAALSSGGLPPRSALLVVAVRLTGLTTPPELAVAVAEEIVRSTTLPAMVTGAARPGTVLAVLAGGRTELAGVPETLRDTVSGLVPGLGPGRLAVGVSGPVGEPGGLPGAVEQAEHALTTALAGSGGPGTVVSAGDLASHLLLLSGVPPEARRAFRDRVLGPVLAYDEAHDADLVGTLDEFLACSGSWSRAAERLHLHVNTLRYRIGRIEQLTGRDLSRFPDRVDFHLALRLPH